MITDILKQNTELNEQIKNLKNQVNQNLLKLNKIVEPIFSQYVNSFENIQYEAQSFDIQLPILEDGGFGRWGNQGLTHLSYENKGFVTLHTKDYFRNETDYYEAFLPLQYFVENGLEVIEQDINAFKYKFKAVTLENELRDNNNYTQKKLKV